LDLPFFLDFLLVDELFDAVLLDAAGAELECDFEVWVVFAKAVPASAKMPSVMATKILFCMKKLLILGIGSARATQPRTAPRTEPSLGLIGWHRS